MSDQAWLIDLVDEFQTAAGIAPTRIARLARMYGDRQPAVMAEAVKRYMLAGASFFPRVGELLPHVETAQRQADNAAQGPRRPAYTDDQIYEFEIKRGTLPDPEVSKRETEKARAYLAGVATRKCCGALAIIGQPCRLCGAVE